MFEDESTTETVKQHRIRLVSGLITRSLEKASQVKDDAPVDEIPQNKKLLVWSCYKETMKNINLKGLHGLIIRENNNYETTLVQFIKIMNRDSILHCISVFLPLFNNSFSLLSK